MLFLTSSDEEFVRAVLYGTLWYEVEFPGFDRVGFCTFSAHGIPPSRRLDFQYISTDSKRKLLSLL
jgi:hypothetical protein